MKVIAYLRVSTAEQADSGLGIEAQRAAILREAQARGWDEASIEWINDAGFSAKSMKRPGLTIALEAMRDGRGDILVVAKTDRLSRSLLDFVSITQTAQKQGWLLLALDSPSDPTTAAGEAMSNMLAVFAQFERRCISERTAAALERAKSNGVTLGRPRTLAADTVARILSERESGTSYNAIARSLNAENVPTAQGGNWAAATVRKVALTYA
jgi:DNA invertase Pin-like site-specific DNA recombinase